MTAHAKAQNVPKELIYEVFNGRPIYYRGYRDVLLGIKKPEDIMGSSILQSLIVSILNTWIANKLGGQFFVLTNELGLQLAKKEQRSADIALYPKAILRDKLSSVKYADIAPQILIEVDTKADLEDLSNPQNYYFEKTKQLLDWGVERLIWVFTDSRKIMVAEKGKKWTLQDWSEPVRIHGRASVNLEKLWEDAIK